MSTLPPTVYRVLLNTGYICPITLVLCLVPLGTLKILMDNCVHNAIHLARNAVGQAIVNVQNVIQQGSYLMENVGKTVVDLTSNLQSQMTVNHVTNNV